MKRRGSVRSPRVTRKRRRAEEKAEQEAAVVCKVEEEAEESAMLTELEQLLGPGEAAAWLMKEEVYQPHGDAALTDLLQQLADYEDETSTSTGHSPHYISEAGSTSAPPNMAARQKAARSSDNKNALAARLNRLRKKEYVHGLEGQVTRLSEDNQRLERDRSELRERVRNLEEEVRYLRAVLANDSALAGLLGGLTKLGGVKLTTSLFLHREKKPREHDYALPGEEDAERAPPAGGGVCLHVDQGNVSVEFCPVCAGRAAASAAAAAAAKM